MLAKIIVLVIATTALFAQTMLLFRDVMLFALILDAVGLFLFGGWLFH